jgi:hypothetical protein
MPEQNERSAMRISSPSHISTSTTACTALVPYRKQDESACSPPIRMVSPSLAPRSLSDLFRSLVQEKGNPKGQYLIHSHDERIRDDAFNRSITHCDMTGIDDKDIDTTLSLVGGITNLTLVAEHQNFVNDMLDWSSLAQSGFVNQNSAACVRDQFGIAFKNGLDNSIGTRIVVNGAILVGAPVLFMSISALVCMNCRNKFTRYTARLNHIVQHLRRGIQPRENIVLQPMPPQPQTGTGR